jgi:hypothetical protein
MIDSHTSNEELLDGIKTALGKLSSAELSDADKKKLIALRAKIDSYIRASAAESA